MGASSNVPTQPRDATTVVVARPTSEGPNLWPEIFMVRRSSQSPFMPSTYVFPGGRVEGNDGAPGSDEAFMRAGRRECEEETRLNLWDRPLWWFDTWITPSAEPRRYRARFYVTLLAANEGDGASADGHETHDGAWLTVEHALARWERGQIDLPPPTLATLLRMRGRSLDGLRDLGRLDATTPILPKWVRLDGRDCVVLPHDPEYPDLPGEGMAPPARVLELPRRFLREETRWIAHRF